MKKKELLELTIDYIRFPHHGMTRYEGELLSVPYTLPGQKVVAQVGKKRRGALECRLMEVLSPSPLETQAGCPAFGRCGGCTYQTISYEEENKIKERQVLELLEKAGITGFAYEGIASVPNIEGYRNKCEFSFGDEYKEGPLALGMRKRQSYYEVVTCPECNIIDGDFRAIVAESLAFFREKQVSFYHKGSHSGCLRHLILRRGEYTGEVLVNLVNTSDPSFDLKEFADRLLALELRGHIAGILHSVNDGVADTTYSQGTTLLYGQDFFTDHLFDLKFKISPYSFFQTNTRGAEVLYGIVREFAGDIAQKTIFDLYCGTGTIGQIMSRGSKAVYGIELVEEAVEAAKVNAAKNGIDNCTFIAGDVLKLVDTLTERPDLIIVDPPREGIVPKALEKIIAFGAPEIVYVSCKPSSLARDLQVFVEQGYAPTRVKLVNQFPRTDHVESVVLLKRQAQ